MHSIKFSSDNIKGTKYFYRKSLLVWGVVQEAKIAQDHFQKAQLEKQKLNHKFGIARNNEDIHGFHHVPWLKHYMHFPMSFVKVLKADVVNSRRACESQPRPTIECHLQATLT